MAEQIVVEIDENGGITAETFGITGPSCLDKLDKLLKDFDKGDDDKKPDFYKSPVLRNNKVTNKY